MPACLGPQHHICNKFDRLETHLRIYGGNSPTRPEELDSGIIPGGMAAADDEADALAQNEGDAQEVAGTTYGFAYLFVICKCVLHYAQLLLQIVRVC